ncbi:MAG: hypothetical protein KDB22_20220, partial [Planctomycetales bacterium]|nr:hypothetical protein [Planctomycetales bacterium]
IRVLATSDDGSTSTADFVIAVQDVDDTSPEASSVKVRAQSWMPPFLAAVDVDLVGYSITDQEVLSWINLDTLSIQFNEQVNVSESALSLTGLVGNGTASSPIDYIVDFGIFDFDYDIPTMTATWVLDDVFAKVAGSANSVLVSLTGVTDTAGNPLAALTIDEFYVNPGDIDQNGIVDFTDLGLLYPTKIGVAPSAADEVARADIDGNGIVDFTDLGLFYPNRIGVQIPSLGGSLPAFSAENDGSGQEEGSVDDVFGDTDSLEDLLLP